MVGHPEVSVSVQCYVRGQVVSVGAGGRGDSHAPSSRLFVKLSYDTERETLEEMFPNATDVFLPRDRETGEKRGSVPAI